ncbi:HAD family hydrolase [Lachnospiraceae bacterium ZAX-1]
MEYRAGIFDLDNTLYNYDSCNDKANQALCEFTCSVMQIGKQQFYDVYQLAKQNIKSRLGDVAAGHHRLLYFQNFVEQMKFSQLSVAFEMYNIYWDTFLCAMQLYDGVMEFLKKMKYHEIKIAICTDLTAHIQFRKLEQLKIMDYIDVLVTSEEVGEEKPSQKMFARTLEKLEIVPGLCFFVGDSLERDIKGAEQMNIKVIWFRNEKLDVLNYGCDQISDFAELAKKIGI